MSEGESDSPLPKDDINVTIRLDKDLYELTRQAAEKRRETMSQFIKRSLQLHLADLGLLSEEERKYLGLTD